MQDSVGQSNRGRAVHVKAGQVAGSTAADVINLNNDCSCLLLGGQVKLISKAPSGHTRRPHTYLRALAPAPGVEHPGHVEGRVPPAAGSKQREGAVIDQF